jgi:hypothetical protein
MLLRRLGKQQTYLLVNWFTILPLYRLGLYKVLN